MGHLARRRPVPVRTACAHADEAGLAAVVAVSQTMSILPVSFRTFRILDAVLLVV
jgi:hypothetical protein